MNKAFPYTVDQRHYHSFLYECIKRYGCRAAKIPLDAHFTCPTRDGKLSYGGCTFCVASGAGDTIPFVQEDVLTQYQAGKRLAKEKYR